MNIKKADTEKNSNARPKKIANQKSGLVVFIRCSLFIFSRSTGYFVLLYFASPVAAL